MASGVEVIIGVSNESVRHVITAGLRHAGEVLKAFRSGRAMTARDARRWCEIKDCAARGLSRSKAVDIEALEQTR